MANRVTSLVSISALIISTSSAANATCYYPNGVENHGGACRPDAEVSACCGPSFVCLSNQLCAVGPDTRRTYAYKYYRSGCTDPYWNSSSCSQVCTEPQYNLGGGQGLQSCGNNEYCCATNYDCCTNSTSIFSMDVGKIVTTIPGMGDSESSSTAAPDSTSATANDTGSSRDSNAVAIGVGLGVGLGGFLFLLIASALIFCHRRRREAALGAAQFEATSELEARGPARQPDPNIFERKHEWDARAQALIHEANGEPNARIPKEPQELEHEPIYELGGGNSVQRDEKLQTGRVPHI